MRKLASIQKIIGLEPIEGADNIMKAKVLGWELVIKKGEYAVGDFCIYCEIDSVLPNKPEFEFLKSKNFRIRTIRLRGQISQGICFPLSMLPEGFILLCFYKYLSIVIWVNSAHWLSKRIVLVSTS